MVNRIVIYMQIMSCWCKMQEHDKRGRCLCLMEALTRLPVHDRSTEYTVKILKVGTPQTIAIIVLKLVKFDVTLH